MTTEGPAASPAQEPTPGRLDVDNAREWTTDEVLGYLVSRGRRITAATWYSYVSRGQAPAAKRHVGRTPVWRPTDIERYVDESPGEPGRPRKS